MSVPIKSSRNPWWVLANVSVGTFMATLDTSIANVALPTLSDALRAPVHLAQWVLTAYLLTICAMLPIVGKLADRVGRSRVYNYGFLLFAVGSALCGWSGTLGALIGSRVVQALGAACLMGNSQAIVAGIFRPEQRGRAIGVIGMIVSLGSLTGPGVGGILVAVWGWPAIFWINVPIGAVGFLAGLVLLPKDNVRELKPAFDYIGSGLFIVGIVSFLYVISNGQDWGWRSPITLFGLAGALLALLLFYRFEKHTEHPMLDFELYRIRAFAVGSVSVLLAFTALFTMAVMMPFYLEDVLLFSTRQTGYLMMVYPIAMAVVSPLSGWLSDRMGSRTLTMGGLVLNALGFGLLQTLTAHQSLLTLVPILALFGIGTGLFQSPNNSSILGAVPRDKLGVAGSLNALVRNLGMVLGTALSVSLFSSRLRHFGGFLSGTPEQAEAVLAALHPVFWTALGICLVALFISSLRAKGKVLQPEPAR